MTCYSPIVCRYQKKKRNTSVCTFLPNLRPEKVVKKTFTHFTFFFTKSISPINQIFTYLQQIKYQLFWEVILFSFPDTFFPTIVNSCLIIKYKVRRIYRWKFYLLGVTTFIEGHGSSEKKHS